MPLSSWCGYYQEKHRLISERGVCRGFCELLAWRSGRRLRYGLYARVTRHRRRWTARWTIPLADGRSVARYAACRIGAATAGPVAAGDAAARITAAWVTARPGACWNAVVAAYRHITAGPGGPPAAATLGNPWPGNDQQCNGSQSHKTPSHHIDAPFEKGVTRSNSTWVPT